MLVRGDPELLRRRARGLRTAGDDLAPLARTALVLLVGAGCSAHHARVVAGVARWCGAEAVTLERTAATLEEVDRPWRPPADVTALVAGVPAADLARLAVDGSVTGWWPGLVAAVADRLARLDARGSDVAPRSLLALVGASRAGAATALAVLAAAPGRWRPTTVDAVVEEVLAGDVGPGPVPVPGPGIPALLASVLAASPRTAAALVTDPHLLARLEEAAPDLALRLAATVAVEGAGTAARERALEVLDRMIRDRDPVDPALAGVLVPVVTAHLPRIATALGDGEGGGPLSPAGAERLVWAATATPGGALAVLGAHERFAVDAIVDSGAFLGASDEPDPGDLGHLEGVIIAGYRRGLEVRVAAEDRLDRLVRAVTDVVVTDAVSAVGAGPVTGLLTGAAADRYLISRIGTVRDPARVGLVAADGALVALRADRRRAVLAALRDRRRDRRLPPEVRRLLGTHDPGTVGGRAALDHLLEPAETAISAAAAEELTAYRGTPRR